MRNFEELTRAEIQEISELPYSQFEARFEKMLSALKPKDTRSYTNKVISALILPNEESDKFFNLQKPFYNQLISAIKAKTLTQDKFLHLFKKHLSLLHPFFANKVTQQKLQALSKKLDPVNNQAEKNFLAKAYYLVYRNLEVIFHRLGRRSEFWGLTSDQNVVSFDLLPTSLPKNRPSIFTEKKVNVVDNSKSLNGKIDASQKQEDEEAYFEISSEASFDSIHTPEKKASVSPTLSSPKAAFLQAVVTGSAPKVEDPDSKTPDSPFANDESTLEKVACHQLGYRL